MSGGPDLSRTTDAPSVSAEGVSPQPLTGHPPTNADTSSRPSGWQTIDEKAALIAECVRICEGWLAIHGPSAPEFVSARKWANDAVKDIRDAIQDLAPVGSAPPAEAEGSIDQ